MGRQVCLTMPYRGLKVLRITFALLSCYIEYCIRADLILREFRIKLVRPQKIARQSQDNPSGSPFGLRGACTDPSNLIRVIPA